MQIVVPAYSSGETDDTMPPAFVGKKIPLATSVPVIPIPTPIFITFLIS